MNAFNWRNVPEPPELAEQVEQARLAREHAAIPCADCGEPRSSHVPDLHRGYGKPACQFKEPS